MQICGECDLNFVQKRRKVQIYIHIYAFCVYIEMLG